MDQVYFNLALNFEKMAGGKNDAILFYDLLISEYPKSSLAAEAKKNLKKLNSSTKNGKKK